MTGRPMLGDLELAYVQALDVAERQVLTEHPVPALEGDFLQSLGRRASRISVAGIAAGDTAAETLRKLREAFRDAAPLPFTADIATATRLDRVIVEAMGVRELAGNPQRFEFVLTLREYLAPPPAERETPARPPAPAGDPVDEAAGTEAADANAASTGGVADGTGTLTVHIDLNGGDDVSGITVRVESSSGGGYSTFSDRQTDGTYTFTGVPAGEYQVRAELP